MTEQPRPPRQRETPQLAAWRKALAAHAKARRRGRHRRTPPQITGIRIDPGRRP